MKFKEYLGKLLLGRKLRFKCDCTSRIDTAGTVVGYYVLSGELVVKVQTPEGKTYEIGENHPSMHVDEL